MLWCLLGPWHLIMPLVSKEFYVWSPKSYILSCQLCKITCTILRIKNKIPQIPVARLPVPGDQFRRTGFCMLGSPCTGNTSAVYHWGTSFSVMGCTRVSSNGHTGWLFTWGNVSKCQAWGYFWWLDRGHPGPGLGATLCLIPGIGPEVAVSQTPCLTPWC